MRILMVAPQPFFRPRGTPLSVLHRIRAFLRLGHTVDLVTYPFGSTPELNGLVVHRAARPPMVRDVAIGPSVAKILLDAPLFYKAYHLTRRERFDLLHTHEEAGFFGAWLSRVCRIPHLYDMHSSLPEQFANFGRFNWPPIVFAFRRMERYTLDRAEGVIAICPELRDYLKRSGYRGPLALIENTLDYDVPVLSAEDVGMLAERLGIDRGARVVLYTGTLEHYQALDLLIAAAAEVRDRVPTVRFVIVGGTPDQIEGLRREARVQQVDSAFIFVPAVPPADVFLYHRLADVLVTTRARGINTPLKVYQYLRAGKPIVATAISSHTQVLTPESAELVVPTPAAIATGLVRVLTDDAHAGALAESARRLAQDRYTEEAYMSRLRGLLEQLPGRPQRQRAAA